MTAFWLVAGSMLAFALLCVAWPLARRADERGTRDSRSLLVTLCRDELARADAEFHGGALSRELHAATRREIEARLLDDVASAESARAPQTSAIRGVATRAGTAALLVALMPAAAFALYLHLGEPGALTLDRAYSERHGVASGPLELMVSRLAIRLREQPADADGWAMLARSYFALDRARDASAAYARAVALTQGDAQLRADYADAIASGHDGSLGGDASVQIQAALAIDPSNPKALALAGSAAQDRKDYVAAIHYWQRLEAVLVPDSPAAAQARRKIGEMQALIGDRTGGR
jgi:cytochrome c-type biogenesis protein CcmH